MRRGNRFLRRRMMTERSATWIIKAPSLHPHHEGEMNDYHHHHHHLLVLYFDDNQVTRNKKSFSFQVHQSHHKCFIPFPNFCFFQLNNFTIPTIRKRMTKRV